MGMEMGELRGVPLFESGNAPRYLVTDFDRLEKTAEGLFTFVGTRSCHTAGREERQVVVYIDATIGAIVKSIILSFFNVDGLMERLNKARFLTFH